VHVGHIFTLFLDLEVICLEVVHANAQWVMLCLVFSVSSRVRSNYHGLDAAKIKSSRLSQNVIFAFFTARMEAIIKTAWANIDTFVIQLKLINIAHVEALGESIFIVDFHKLEVIGKHLSDFFA